MLVSNGTTRRKLGLSNSSTDQNVVGKVSSRRLINSSQPSPTSSSTKSSSHKHTPTKNSTAKNLNEQLKLKKSLTSSAKSSTKKTATAATTTTTTTPSNKLNTSVKSLKNTSNNKSSAKKQKLKERRHQRDEDDENDENEPDEYRYRDEDDLMHVDDTDTVIGANEFEMPLIHMSHEEFERVDKCIESRLDELKRKLDALKSIDLTSSPTRHHHIDPYLSEFCAELERLENEARANLTSIRFWFDKESFEIEEHYKNECKRSIHEYQERRKELRETLRNENEDARKQIEIERQTLDINSDVIEVKPAPTRNLRRRCGGGGPGGGSAGNNNTTSGSNSLFSSQVYFDTLEAAAESMPMNSVGSGVGGVGAGGPPQTGASASFINTNHQSPLLTSNLSNVVETSSSVNGLYFASLIQQPSNGSSSLLNGSIIDRKQRKVGPLAITISEDEINEDHRCLLRSLKQPHSASPKPCMYS